MSTESGLSAARYDRWAGVSMSILFNATTTGAFGVTSSPAAVINDGGGPSATSARYTMTSASVSARRATARMARWSSYFGLSRPGVSRITICTSSVVRMPTMRSRVDCGFSLVMLSFWPMIRLSRVDLPAFGFPTTATIPERVIGRS
jgi:hypothetical protein